MPGLVPSLEAPVTDPRPHHSVLTEVVGMMAVLGLNELPAYSLLSFVFVCLVTSLFLSLLFPPPSPPLPVETKAMALGVDTRLTFDP